MSSRGKTCVRVLLLAAALVSAFLLFGRKAEYSECEKKLQKAQEAMDTAGISGTSERVSKPAAEERQEAAGALESTESAGTLENPEVPGILEVPGEADAGGINPQLPEEFFARLLIPSANADLPIMRPPEAEPQKYLHRDMFGEESAYGSVYTDLSTDLASPCLVLYGHHMKNGAMFGMLGDLSPGDRVTLAAPDVTYEYEVLGSFTITPEEEAAVKALSLRNEQDAETLFRQAQKTGTLLHKPEPGRRHLALVTCEYKRPDERLAVLCEEVP